MIGTSLGPYRVLEQLGAGGMGEVYLAEDTRLNRKVAVKVLPDEFAADSERLARFEQEARAAAALNHPHIAVVHDVGFVAGSGRVGGVHYIVQEYLEGEPLRAPLEKGALPLAKALQYAREIAEALAAAHDAGIVHRDLKPDNVFLTDKGHAKVLDFGLAKLTEAATADDGHASMSPTLLGTAAGQVMGTAGYMSPEQVEGETDIDGRADIFAFGCVLYEMAVGRRAFTGKSVLDTLHAITRTEPQPIGEIRADAPVDLERILAKCLTKDPANRYQHADDLLVDLKRLSRDVDTGSVRTVAQRDLERGVAGSRRSVLPIAAAAFAVGALLTALAFGYVFRPVLAPSQPVMRFNVPLPEGLRATATPGPMAFSPDGSLLVISLIRLSTSVRTLWVVPLDGSPPRELAGTDDAERPFFSPDGGWVGFTVAGELRRVSVEGGPHLPIATLPSGVAAGAVWGQDDRIIFGLGGGGLWSVTASSGIPEQLVPVGEGAEFIGAVNPQRAGADVVLFQGLRNDGVVAIYALSLRSGSVRELHAPASLPLYLSSGHIAYFVDATLFVAPFDEHGMALVGDPVPMETGIFAQLGAPHVAASANGTLAFFTATGGAMSSDLVWRSLDGGIEAIATPQRQGLFYFPSLSPDGTRAAYSMFEEGGRERTNMIMDLERGMAQEVGPGYHIEWSPDGEDLYVTDDNIADLDIYRIPADLSGGPTPVLGGPLLQIPRDVSPDGEWLLVAQTPAALSTDYDLLLLSLTEGGEPRPLFADPDRTELDAEFSPDGNWIVWVSALPGDPFEIYVTSFPSTGGPIQISEGGGWEPAWSPDGKQLFFRRDQQVFVVDVDTSNGFQHSQPRPLFRGGFQLAVQQSGSFDVAPEGDRLLMFVNPEATGDTVGTGLSIINVVVNWLEAVRVANPRR